MRNASVIPPILLGLLLAQTTWTESWKERP